LKGLIELKIALIKGKKIQRMRVKLKNKITENLIGEWNNRKKTSTKVSMIKLEI